MSSNIKQNRSLLNIIENKISSEHLHLVASEIFKQITKEHRTDSHILINILNQFQNIQFIQNNKKNRIQPIQNQQIS